jgi:hypothetical protein
VSENKAENLLRPEKNPAPEGLADPIPKNPSRSNRTVKNSTKYPITETIPYFYRFVKPYLKKNRKKVLFDDFL